MTICHQPTSWSNASGAWPLPLISPSWKSAPRHSQGFELRHGGMGVHFLQVWSMFPRIAEFFWWRKNYADWQRKNIWKKNCLTLGFLKKFIFPWCRFLKGTLVVGFGGESSLIFTKGRKINPHGIHWKMGSTQMKGYCWRNPAPVGRQFIPLFTRFIHSRWCRMSSINSIKQAA